MVNYCCVYGCGRNSRLNTHLIFYRVPKEKHRQEQWMKAAGREDLLAKAEKSILRSRFCSRHFKPSYIKKRTLAVDAFPTIHIPGSEGEDTDWGAEILRHDGIVCNNCQTALSGFRYKCISCSNYDLCQKCEGLEVHPNHFMLRIPKPIKLVTAENLTKQLHTLIKAELISDDPSCHDEGTADISGESSDDEPIKKYASNYDSGVDLSEDVKERIRKEVSRVLNLKPKKNKSNPKTIAEKKRTTEELPRSTKKPKLEDSNYNCNISSERVAELQIAPEVVFADVNEVKDSERQVAEMKSKLLESANFSARVPVMHLKLSDDLSELMIEVTSTTSSEKAVYMYGESQWNQPNPGGS